MTERRSEYTYIVIAAIVIILIFAGFFLYRNFTGKSMSGINAIPSKTLFFVEVNDIESLWKDVNNHNEIWRSLSKINAVERINQQLQQWDTTLFQDEYAHDLLENGKLYISVLSRSSDSLASLFILEMDGNKSYIENFIENHYAGPSKIEEQKILKRTVFSVNDEEGKAVLHYVFEKGLFIACKYPDMIEQALKAIDSEVKISQNESFKRVAKTAGKKVNSHIYLHLKNIGDFVKKLVDEEYRESASLLNNFATWGELDLILKSDELLLNGYADVSDSAMQFLDIFKQSPPQKIQLTSIIPFNTNLLLWFGYDDFNKVNNKLEEYLRKNNRFEDHYNEILRLNKKYKTNIETNIFGWIGNEAALVSLAGRPSELREKTYFVVHTPDPTRANQLLTEIYHNASGSSMHRYNNFLIKHINISGFIPGVFGQVFSLVNQTYYAIINEYIIFANSSDALEEFINAYQSGKTLQDNINYKEFSDNISDKSNIYLYYNSRNALPVLDEYVRNDIRSQLNMNEQHLSNFHAFAVQFSLVNNMFYTNAYIRYNPEYREENRALWKTNLDGGIATQPFLVKDHTDKTYNILVSDENNQLYLIDNNGNILWKRSLDGKIMSEIHPVDYYKNRKIQYLFNTENKLYLIDLLGRDVANYPISFGTKPTNGIALFDYINNKTYRILYAGEDNRIYNYDIKGKDVKGWTKPRVNNMVNIPLKHVIAGNRDYIIIPQDNGDVKITDRRGNDRIKIRDDFRNAANSEFYENKTNSKGVMLTTDQKGHLTYIKTNGHLDRTVFGDFGPGHYFLYEDLNKDGAKDFIFLDGTHLVVYDRFKNSMFEYTFDNTINIKPQIIQVSYRENLLGVVNSVENNIYLFNSKGEPVLSAGMAGETAFTTGSLNNDKNLNLIVGAGSTLYNYLLK